MGKCSIRAVTLQPKVLTNLDDDIPTSPGSASHSEVGSARHPPAKGIIGSIFVVLTAPCLDHSAGVQQAGEPVLVEALVAQPAVEAPDIGVLVGLAWLDQTQRDTKGMGPLEHGRAAELLAVVGSDDPGKPPAKRKPIQSASHAMPGDAPPH